MEHIDSSRPVVPDTNHDPFDDGRALQDRLQSHCSGCGTLDAHGSHIKSRWQGDEFACFRQPGPEHVGFPGCVVACSVRQRSVECATAETITVRIQGAV